MKFLLLSMFWIFSSPFWSIVFCLDVSPFQGHRGTLSHLHQVLILDPINAVFETMDLSFITSKKGL